MKVRRYGFLRKSWFLVLVGGSVVLSVLLVLRSVFAFSFFKGLSNTLRDSAWRHSESQLVVPSGEEMTFEASYLFVKFGSLRFQVVDQVSYDSLPAYHLRAYIDSYNGIPFVNFHAVYDTYADTGDLSCIFNLKREREGDSLINTTTSIDSTRKRFVWMQTENNRLLKLVDLPYDTNYTNGVSLVYRARQVCQNSGGRKMSLVVPIIDDTVKSKVELTVNEAREACDVTAFDFPIDSRRLSGRLDFTGTFGISGDFVGWMSADSSIVPLKAKVKVIIGNVVVELKEIKKNNWVPPHAGGSE